MRTTTSRTALAALVLLLTSCGGAEPSTEAETFTADNGEEITRADVTFVTGILQHHAEALAVVDLTLGRELEPALRRVVEEIRSEHAREVETLTTWLTDWGEEVPETVRDHANAHAGEGDHAELEAATGARFTELWVPAMVEALEQCVALAEGHEGHHAGAGELAGAVVESHRGDIQTLEGLR